MKYLALFFLVSFGFTSYGQKCKIEFDDGDFKQNKSVKIGSNKGFSIQLAVGKDGDGEANFVLLKIARTGAYFTIAKDKNLIIEFSDGTKATLKNKERIVGRKKGLNYSLEAVYWIYGENNELLRSKEIKQITVYTDHGYFPLEFEKKQSIVMNQLKCLD